MHPRALRHILFASLSMLLVGGGTLVYLVTRTYPLLWARWLFFSALVLTVTGLVTPLLALIYRRFAAHPVPERSVLREGLLSGVYVGLLAWFQLGRMVTPFLVITLALTLFLLEVGIRLWEIRRR